MRHEEFNPVPVDELTRGGLTLSIMAMQKVIPALIAGNSVILRPSPLTPLSSLALGAAADAAGLPPGVLSVIIEAGSAGAELLSAHPAWTWCPSPGPPRSAS
jgi:hypothetical protein